MSVPQPVRVVLDIDRAERTISGRMAVDGAPASGFYGWLELIHELGRVAALPETTIDQSGTSGCAH